MTVFAALGNVWQTPFIRGEKRHWRKEGWQGVGREKSIWAEKIAPRMDVESNKSPSFHYFKNTLQRLSKQAEEQAQQRA